MSFLRNLTTQQKALAIGGLVLILILIIVLAVLFIGSDGDEKESSTGLVSAGGGESGGDGSGGDGSGGDGSGGDGSGTTNPPPELEGEFEIHSSDGGQMLVTKPGNMLSFLAAEKYQADVANGVPWSNKWLIYKVSDGVYTIRSKIIMSFWGLQTDGRTLVRWNVSSEEAKKTPKFWWNVTKCDKTGHYQFSKPYGIFVQSLYLNAEKTLPMVVPKTSTANSCLKLI